MQSNKYNSAVKANLAGLIAACCAAGPAFGHAAEQGFVLLLPTQAYITGGTLVVIATVLLLLLVRRGWLGALFSPRHTGLKATYVTPPGFVPVVASLILAVLILIGLKGPTDPQANLWPLVLWTLWWMLLFVVQGVLFDVWKWVNPWPGLHQLLVPDPKPPLTLPAGLSVWPAVLLMILFQGYVLADVAPNDPGRLARFALGYWLFTLLGMSLFGRAAWLRQVECFSVLFELIGRFRIARADQTLSFGLPGWQLFHGEKPDLSHAVFILVLLAGGSFDGLHETFWWLAQVGVNPLEYPGRTAMIWSTSAGLLASMVGLIAVFAGAVWTGQVLAKPERHDFKQSFTLFALSLVPIAIGYHFAHYLVTFLVQSQVVIATIADPLAAGWNLFGLGSARVKVGFLTVPGTVKFIWLTQAGIIVLSHVMAVLISHRTAELLCDRPRDVLRIQLGLTLLMIFYTIFGLWLLASPRGA